MRIALVLPGTIWYAPYVKIYTKLLDNMKVDYCIISWNRDGKDKPEGFQYEEKCEKGHGSANFAEYRGYVHFIKRTIKQQKINKVIVFGPQMTCLLSAYLLSHFRGRYMIDYRDLSIEQKKGFRRLYSLMLRFSCFNVISSPGFKKYLPKREYLLSHNFDKDIVSLVINEPVSEKTSFTSKEKLNVLTIGAIRDYDSNLEVIKALANRPDVEVHFVGRGDTAIILEEYCKNNGISNVSFNGFYPKEEEADYIHNADYLNIFYPRKRSHDSALSNRFYNSLIYKKPMLVTKDTIQGDYAEKYKVGVAVKECGNNLEGILREFLKQDYHEYSKRCNELLASFLKDQEQFEEAIKLFCEN